MYFRSDFVCDYQNIIIVKIIFVVVGIEFIIVIQRFLFVIINMFVWLEVNYYSCIKKIKIIFLISIFQVKYITDEKMDEKYKDKII